jgi:Carboxypeptidase regulatory-like domain
MTGGNIAAMRFRHILAVVFLLLPCLRPASAQIIEGREVGGKQVTCMHSGMMSSLKNCGSPEWYAYIFVGTISAITPIGSDEQRIQVIPGEIFKGKPQNPLTIETSQALCLSPLNVGDQWLFYLREEKDKPIVLDYYGNDSKPVANAREEIATLRRLQTIGDMGILRGQVVRGRYYAGTPVPDAHVVAFGGPERGQFTATTDSDGRYEFEPLSPGNYVIRVEAIGSYKPDNSTIEIKPASCWDLSLDRSPHARIAGHITQPDGLPASHIDVVLIDADNSGYITAQTDQDGLFEFNSVLRGDYVVGLNFPPRKDWFNGSGAGEGVKLPPATLFYPNAKSRSRAKVIRLATDENIDDIDIILPEK